MDGLQPLTPESYLAVVSRTLWENLPQMIGGGLLFSLAAAPAFIAFSLGWLGPTMLLAVAMVAPAWCALVAFSGIILAGKVVALREWFAYFRHHGRAATLLGMAPAFPGLVLLRLLPLLQTDHPAPSVWAAVGMTIFVMALALALLLYAFPLLAEQDKLSRNLWVQAWLLAVQSPLNTVGLLAMGVLFLFAIAYVSLGLLLLLPAIYALFIAANYQLVVAAHHSAEKV